MNRRKFLKATSFTALAIPFTDFTAVLPQRQPNELQMFNNGIDTVICKNIDEAQLLVAKHYFGENATAGPLHSEIWGYQDSSLKLPIYYDEVDPIDSWEEFDPESNFTIYTDYSENNRIIKKVKDWIAEQGPGYFASTEY